MHLFYQIYRKGENWKLKTNEQTIHVRSNIVIKRKKYYQIFFIWKVKFQHSKLNALKLSTIHAARVILPTGMWLNKSPTEQKHEQIPLANLTRECIQCKGLCAHWRKWFPFLLPFLQKGQLTISIQVTAPNKKLLSLADVCKEQQYYSCRGVQ